MGSYNKRSSGASLVEYVLLIGLIALAAIAGMNLFGTAVSDKYSSIASQMPD